MNQPGLSFEAVVTLEDMVALHARLLASPAMQASRLRRELLVVVAGFVCAPFGLVLATWVAGMANADPPSLAAVVADLTHEQWPVLVMAVVFVPACLAISIAAQRLLLRSRLRRLFRRLLRTRADVDPSDRRLAFRSQVSVGDEGVEGRSSTGSTLLAWSAVDHWEEADGRLLMLGKGMSGFCLNEAAADPASIAQFRDDLIARLGPPRAVRRGPHGRL